MMAREGLGFRIGDIVEYKNVVFKVLAILPQTEELVVQEDPTVKMVVVNSQSTKKVMDDRRANNIPPTLTGPSCSPKE